MVITIFVLLQDSKMNYRFKNTCDRLPGICLHPVRY
jgi:hypothetical protein